MKKPYRILFEDANTIGRYGLYIERFQTAKEATDRIKLLTKRDEWQYSFFQVIKFIGREDAGYSVI